MQSGNGVDLAAIHQLLTEVAQSVRGHGERFDRIEVRLEHVELRLDSHERKLNEITVAVNDHTRQLARLITIVNDHTHKIDELAASLGELRLTVSQVQNAVIGHGLDITDFKERLSRLD